MCLLDSVACELERELPHARLRGEECANTFDKNTGETLCKT